MGALRRVGWVAVPAWTLALALTGPSLGAEDRSAAATRVHAVVDIAHEFSFYFDGRFATQYLRQRGNANVQNWATLHKVDLGPANLLVLPCGASSCPYTPADVKHVREFLQGGGGVALLGDFATFRKQKTYQLNAMAKAFGAEFLNERASGKVTGTVAGKAAELKHYGGKVIRLAEPKDWTVLVRDANGKVVAARRAVGKGKLLVCSRGLSGRQPDAKDPINAEWWTPLLTDLASGKAVDPKRRPRGQRPENSHAREGLEIRYTDYMKPYADEIFAVYKRCRPAMEVILGVPPAKGMLTSLILLPTGGGGFSSGHTIGLGTWWGGFPEKKYGMVELLGHEGTHSWVLPFAEPMWNEGIATYVGIYLGKKLGYKAEAERTLAGWIRGAKRHDPDMTRYDLAHGKDIPHVVSMAKPMWIFEQLRKEKPDVLARYFRAKRRLIDPKNVRRYTADDSVAVLSVAMGRDLFPWFRSLGIDVSRSRTNIPIKP